MSDNVLTVSFGTFSRAMLRERSLTEPELRELQQVVRASGKCGSLQTADGLPCGRQPKAGYTVCRKHGERAPATIAKAERILAAARIPALNVLLDVVDQWEEDVCDTCGFPRHSVKETKMFVATAKAILDRAGMGPRSTIDINARSTSDQSIDVKGLTDEEKVELRELLEPLERFRARVAARQGLAPGGPKMLSSSSSNGSEE